MPGFVQNADGEWWTDKDPDDVLDYGRDLADRFPGGAITAVSVAASSGVTAGATSYSGLVATVLVSGGTAGSAGYVTLRVTVDSTKQSDLTLNFNIKQR